MKHRKKLLFAAAVGAATAGTFVVLKFWKPLGGRIEGERLRVVQRSPHWREGKFRNLVPTTLGDLVRSVYLQLTGNEVRVPAEGIPIVRLTARDLAQPAGLRAVWIGHSSVLVDLDGVRFLTDPVWSERCSPFESLGPKRLHPPPIALDDIAPVDAVVISHDHYDHLDMPTIQALASRGATFFVPLGIGAHLERWSVPRERIRELDWNQEAEHRGVRFVALPARHYSGRSVGRDQTQWASWAAIGPKHRVYFSGDTGYFDEFKRIGQTHGPFDLTLMKIGAYGSTWPEIHITPEEAVQAHLDVRGKLMLPIHWATFNLAFHDWYEPAERLVKSGSGRIAFTTPRPGEIVTIEQPPSALWWR
ncbi:MAG TPA: MBL fold metallo-hydrolase [Thermoanaerobaculia bacterium]|nr:MBL fold metallo-hydrolase [Thermoanaerobaculia bacterium]